MPVRYMLWPCLSVCVSVTNLGVLPKWLDSRHKIIQKYHTIAQGLLVLVAKDIDEILVESPPMGAQNAGGVS